MGKTGVIYILTNPSFPQYVKIGYATDVKQRLDELNRSSAVPFAFRMLKGDLQTKKDILLAIGADLEPKRKQIQEIDKNLEDGIFYLLNNLNLRHNNKSKGDKNYRQACVCQLETA